MKEKDFISGNSFLDGNSLLSYIKEQNKLLDTSPKERRSSYKATEMGEIIAKGHTARGYIMGVHDCQNGVIFETPSDIDFGQLRNIVLKYLENNPKKRDLPAWILVMTALLEVFPSRNEKE